MRKKFPSSIDILNEQFNDPDSTFRKHLEAAVGTRSRQRPPTCKGCRGNIEDKDKR